jgi:serine/threonine protein kinase
MMIGALLDQRYRVIRVLGQGGFGHTYVAEDTRRPGNPTCVVKHLKPASNDPDFLKTARRLFNREAETLEKLGSHDQIPRLLAYFEENQEFYLVEEFIDGHPLNIELTPGEKWSEGQVVELLQEVLPILDFVHTNSVIHRDLKPENLIRRKQDNKIVLVDFGAVKQVQMQSIIAQEMVNETVAIGTPGYMPSEQGQGRPRPSSDIYALGMIAIQALTGMNPTQFSEDPDTGEILWQQHAQVSDLLASVLTKMVRHYFKYRYQSATEALQSIEPLTNPHSRHAIATMTKQRVRHYLQGGYQSASKALQVIQNISSIKARQAIATLKSLPSGQPSGSSSNLNEQTATIYTGNSSRSPISIGSFSRIPNKLPLIIGASTVTLVLVAVTLSATRKPSPPVVANGNQTNLKAEANKSDSTSEPNKSDSTSEPNKSDLTSEANKSDSTSEANKSDSSSEPNKSDSVPNPETFKDKNGCTYVVTKASNVRKSARSRKTGEVLKPGTKIAVTGKEQSGWIEISAPEPGWVWKSRTKKTCPSKKSADSKNSDNSSKNDDSSKSDD